MLLKPPSSFAITWSLRLRLAVQRVVRRLATPLVRLTLLSLALGVTGYVLYRTVWIPLHAPVELPGGISPTNPQIDNTLIQEISTARTNRVRRERTNFSRDQNLFRPLSNQ